MTKKDFSFREYFKEVAGFLREKEAEMRRGNLASLEELEETSDNFLLRKWTWTSAIVGAIASFVFMPLLLLATNALLHPVLRELLWAIVKVSMGMTLLMLGAAIYFTMCRENE